MEFASRILRVNGEDGGRERGHLWPPHARSCTVAYAASSARDCRLRETGLCVVEDSREAAWRRVVESGAKLLAPHTAQAGQLERAMLEVFKTRRKGWGVRTTAPIEKGTFVVDYVGEIIRDDKADRMHKVYYWDLDHFDQKDEAAGVSADESDGGSLEPHLVLGDNEYRLWVMLFQALNLDSSEFVKQTWLAAPAWYGEPQNLMALAAAIDYVSRAKGGIDTDEAAAEAGEQAGMRESDGGRAELAAHVRELHTKLLKPFSRWWREQTGGKSLRVDAPLEAEMRELWRDEKPLVIDGERFGNFSRFINDGGDLSNLVVVLVLTPMASEAGTAVEGRTFAGGCAGPAETPRLYRIAFFANRDIRAGEELTYAYGEEYWTALDRQPVYGDGDGGDPEPKGHAAGGAREDAGAEDEDLDLVGGGHAAGGGDAVGGDDVGSGRSSPSSDGSEGLAPSYDEEPGDEDLDLSGGGGADMDLDELALGGGVNNTAQVGAGGGNSGGESCGDEDIDLAGAAGAAESAGAESEGNDEDVDLTGGGEVVPVMPVAPPPPQQQQGDAANPIFLSDSSDEA